MAFLKHVVAALVLGFLLGCGGVPEREEVGTDEGGLTQPRRCPDPNDPRVHYVGNSNTNPRVCMVALVACRPDQTFFSDACGCGCIDNPKPCPDPADPTVHYKGNSNQNPGVCRYVRFACNPGQTMFSDASRCGCGCIDNPKPCPDPADPKVHYMGNSNLNPAVCQYVRFACNPGQTMFTDASRCGCGCIDP